MIASSHKYLFAFNKVLIKEEIRRNLKWVLFTYLGVRRKVMNFTRVSNNFGLGYKQYSV